MNRKLLSVLLSFVMIMTLLPVSISTSAQINVTKADPSFELSLNTWVISPSVSGTTCGLPGGVDSDILKPDYNTGEWIPAEAPGSVLGNLIDNHVYDYLFEPDNDGKPNVYFSDNISKIPFSDFLEPWWYSTDFTIPASESNKRISLQLKGIAFKAEVYINGNKLSNDYTNITDDQELQNGPPVYDEWADPPTTGSNVVTIPLRSNLTEFGHEGLSSYKDKFLGSFRTYDLDITDYINSDNTPNNIKLKIWKPMYKSDSSDDAVSGDLTGFWVDWNPEPTDAMMGINGNVTISSSGVIHLDNPAVSSKVSEDLETASLNLYCDVTNLSSTPVTGSLTAVIKDPQDNTIVTVTKNNVTVPAGAYNKETRLTYRDFPNLNIADPQLWWPHLSGDQPLYNVYFTFFAGSSISDSIKQRFGIREIEAEVNVSRIANSNNTTISDASPANMLTIYINHQPILIKGGAYCPSDLFYRHSDWQDEAIINYVKYMGMNMIRDEGAFYSEELLDLCDENGILYITGWSCCDRWQRPYSWTKAERFVAYESLYSQLRILRSRPSIVFWENGSDHPVSYNANPNCWMVEHKFLEIEAKLRWEEFAAVVLSSNPSADRLLGGISSGKHMQVTYDTQTPTYYYNPQNNIAQFGHLSSEVGGSGIPSVESMRRFLPEENLWPYNTGENYNVWNYHTTRGSFSNLTQAASFIDNTFGPSHSIEEWNFRATAYSFYNQRAMFEAGNMNRFTNVAGMTNWMLNSAWPILLWNIFDAYMCPTGSTYGAMKGNEPLHIMYDMYDKKVCVINNTRTAYNDMTATMSMYDIDGNLINKPLTKTLYVAADGASEPTNYTSSKPMTPKKVGYVYDAENDTFNDLTYTYFGEITEAYGVNRVWDYNTIQQSLTAPTSDVYFIRLELKDADGKVVSYNSYAEVMRNDVATHGAWARGSAQQLPDMTQLNTLPPVDIDCIQSRSVVSDGKVIQTLNVTNDTSSIAYCVYLRAYTDSTEKNLVAPVLFSDNLFILFPGETRTITVSHNSADLAGDAVITVTCYNNEMDEESTPIRSKNIYKAIPTFADSNNLAKGKTVTGGTNPNNTTTVSAANQTRAMNGKTFIDSDANTIATVNPSSGQTLTVDLGSPVAFDRIMLRWNAATNTSSNQHMNKGRPDFVKIEGSDNNAEPWEEIANYDNRSAASVLTNIILPQQKTYRYVRITPTGLRTASSAIGIVSPYLSGSSLKNPYEHGISQDNPPTAFNCSAIEIYAFSNCVNLSIFGEGNVECAGRIYDMTMAANQRVVALGSGNSGVLTFNPVAPNASITVLRDGVDISKQLDGNQLTLTDVREDTNISVYLGDLTANRTKLEAGDTVTVTAVMLKPHPYDGKIIAALYSDDGILESVLPIANAESGKITSGELKLPDDVTGKILKVFLWSSDMYVPICKEITLR